LIATPAVSHDILGVSTRVLVQRSLQPKPSVPFAPKLRDLWRFDASEFFDHTGEYWVEIDSSHPSRKKVQSTIGENLEEEYITIIPENDNRKTTLKVSIQQDGNNNHDLKLNSKP